ncbi:hypothetical protein HBB16_14135 [Pseudonocardia sp. MCCB 268]|nr:hypothetical protein [Pseudonocardia cytotoxica]
MFLLPGPEAQVLPEVLAVAPRGHRGTPVADARLVRRLPQDPSASVRQQATAISNNAPTSSPGVKRSDLTAAAHPGGTRPAEWSALSGPIGVPGRGGAVEAIIRWWAHDPRRRRARNRSGWPAIGTEQTTNLWGGGA